MNWPFPLSKILIFSVLCTHLSAASFNGQLLVTKGDKDLYYKEMGFVDKEKKILISQESQFLIGSISKQITSVLILREVDKGTFSLESPVTSILTDVDIPNTITIHHLLTHTSGIKRVGEPLEFEPGEKFAYTNGGYILLGQLLEKVRGMPYEKLVEELFQTLEMKDSFAPPSGTIEDLQKIFPKLAIGTVEGEVNIETKRDRKENASSGLISTVYDLKKWNRALHGGQLLKAETYAKMMHPWVERKHRFGTVFYGYGVHVMNDPKEIFHQGIIPGYLSTLIYYPEKDLTLIILENHVFWTQEWGFNEQRKCFAFHEALIEGIKNINL